MYVIDHKINKCLYKLRDELTSEYLDWLLSYKNKITEHKRGLARKAISCFILNSYKNNLTSDSRIGLTLDQTSYSTCAIVNGKRTNRKVSYTYTRSFITFLQSEGYIDLYIGGKKTYEFLHNRWVFTGHETSYATLLPKLTCLYNKYDVEYVPTTLSSVIYLRNEDKKNISFKLNDETRKSKDFLYNYNNFSLNYNVSCRDNRYDVQIYKIFNVTLDRGGRGFMKDGIQRLSKYERKDIKIDGQDVCIFDYSGFEPSLCYTMCQEVFEGEDYYDISYFDGWDGYDKKALRNVCKLALLIMFNTHDRRSAHKAINEVLAKEFDVPTLYKEGKIPSKTIPIKDILDDMEKKHHVVMHKFYVGFGAELQYAGSLIVDYITDYMMQSHQCLVLSVFDECIAKEEFREELYSTMVDAYETILGFSDNCKITVEQ